MNQYIQMDPMWQSLPLDLSEKICNSLTKCRTISSDLKFQIEHYELYFEILGVCRDHFDGDWDDLERRLGYENLHIDDVELRVLVKWIDMEEDERFIFFNNLEDVDWGGSEITFSSQGF